MKPHFAIYVMLISAAPQAQAQAQAQVVINQAALAQLAGISPPVIKAPPQIRQPLRKIAYRPVSRHHFAARRLATTGAIPPPTLPPKPAPPIQPAVAKPVIPPTPKPAAPRSAEIAFANGAPDLPAGIAAQLKPFCTHPAQPGSVTIDAYATADPTDPSAAPRLSMTRAFALRDALTACGIPSTSIIPRADGASSKTPDIAVISAP